MNRFSLSTRGLGELLRVGLLSGALRACGVSESGSLDMGEGGGDDSVTPAVADDMTDAEPIANGIYDVIGPLCSSTERTPPYDSLEKPVLVRDFNFFLCRHCQSLFYMLPASRPGSTDSSSHPRSSNSA